MASQLFHLLEAILRDLAVPEEQVRYFCADCADEVTEGIDVDAMRHREPDICLNGVVHEFDMGYLWRRNCEQLIDALRDEIGVGSMIQAIEHRNDPPKRSIEELLDSVKQSSCGG